MARDDPFACPKCGKRFGKETKLRRHQKEAHGVVKSPALYYGVGIAVVAVLVAVVALMVTNASDPRPVDLQLEGQPRMGEASAPVTFVMFEDPDCPFCRRFHENTLDELVRNFVQTGQVAMYYKQFSGGNPWTWEGSIAQECAFRHGGNGAFWNLTRHFYRNQPSISQATVWSSLEQVAVAEGWNSEALLRCYDNQETSGEITKDWSKGRDLGASGTPSFFVHRLGSASKPVFISGAQPYSVFANAIQRALAAGSGEGAGEARSVPTSALAAG